MGSGSASPVASGQFQIDESGKLVKGSVETYRKSGTGAGKKAKAAAQKKSSPGGTKITGPERRPFRRSASRPAEVQPDRRRQGHRRSRFPARARPRPRSWPYAEADTSTTSMRRAQGKAYGRGTGSYLAGQTEVPGEDSAVVEEAASGGGGRRKKKRPAKKLTRRAKTAKSPGGRKVTAGERKKIQAKKGK